MIKKNQTGSLIVDGLISAAIIGIIAVALFAAFGSSKDNTAASSDYVVATNVAQKYIEILKYKGKPFWAGLPEAADFPTDPNVTWPATNYENDFAGTWNGGTQPGIFINVDNMHPATIVAYAYKISAKDIARCKIKITWNPPTVTGTKIPDGENFQSKEYEIFLENDYYMTAP